jgi:hypothetical protein
MTTVQDITKITQAILGAQDSDTHGRVTYLRKLVESTQEELGSEKGQRPAVQMAALKLVHDRFYEIILGAAQPFVPKGAPKRAVELHRRINFARTALSAVRGHVRAGGDVVTLSAAKVTKAALKSREGPVKPLSPARWKTKATAQAKTLLESLTGMAKADKGAAIVEMQELVSALTVRMMKLGLTATKDASVALSEHRPLSVGRGMFVPAKGFERNGHEIAS